MVKIIGIDTRDLRIRRRVYSDVEFVQGLLDDRQIQFDLYRQWTEYFNSHAGGRFIRLEEHRKEIIHNAYIVLWKKVKYGKIAVKDGVIIGSDGLPFKGTLTTYLWSVAIKNNLELWRGDTKMLLMDDIKPKYKVDCDDENVTLTCVASSEPTAESPFSKSSEKLVMREIMADIITNMSERCCQILTLFYYQGLKLDGIMVKLPTFKSKDALKTAKNKCVGRLKIAANARYKEYMNS